MIKISKMWVYKSGWLPKQWTQYWLQRKPHSKQCSQLREETHEKKGNYWSYYTHNTPSWESSCSRKLVVLDRSICFHMARPAMYLCTPFTKVFELFCNISSVGQTCFSPIWATGRYWNIALRWGILIVTPTEGTAHTVVIKNGWSLNEEEIQSSDSPVCSVMKRKWHTPLRTNPSL